MRSPKAPRRRAVIFRSHGLLQIIQGTLRFPCAGCRQLPFCGLAIWGHLAFGKMYEKMSAVEEEANQLYDQLEMQYLAKHKPQNPSSTMEMWKIREQAKMQAEEVVLNQIVMRFH